MINSKINLAHHLFFTIIMIACVHAMPLMSATTDGRHPMKTHILQRLFDNQDGAHRCNIKINACTLLRPLTFDHKLTFTPHWKRGWIMNTQTLVDTQHLQKSLIKQYTWFSINFQACPSSLFTSITFKVKLVDQ